MRQRQYRKVIFKMAFTILLCGMVLLALNTMKPEEVDEFQGTYQWGSVPEIVYFSVDRGGNKFFYTDQGGAVYIKGTIHEVAEHTYEVICNQKEMEEIIPVQRIYYGERSFQMTVAGTKMEFQKLDDTPTVFGDPSDYS